MTLLIPHPYEDGMAEEWIASLRPSYEAGEQVIFAVVLREGGELVGCIGMNLNTRDENAELGYWIGKPYRGQGYCTEAAREMVRFGFEDLGLHRIHANHFGSNLASVRVMEKVGMTYEGTLRESEFIEGAYRDIKLYSILRREYRRA